VGLDALDVGHHHCLAVATEGISKEVGQCSLSVGDVISPAVRESKHNLLEVGQTLVDVTSLLQLATMSVSLLGPLGPSEVDEVELGVDHLFG